MANIPTVRDFMDHKFVTFAPDMDVYEAIDIMLNKNILGACVVDNKQRMVGILSEKDCLRTLVYSTYSNLPSGTVADYMTTEFMHTKPNTDVFTVASIFIKQSFRRLPVLENEELVGQITRRDLLRVIRKLRKSGTT